MGTTHPLTANSSISAGLQKQVCQQLGRELMFLTELEQRIWNIRLLCVQVHRPIVSHILIFAEDSLLYTSSNQKY